MDIGRPLRLFTEAEALERYRAERTVSFVWFRNELWIARKGFRMKRYRPDTNLFYNAPENAPRPGVLTTYEGFLMAADLGEFSYPDGDDTINVPDDPNGIRWSKRFDGDEWDDTVSITAGYKIPSQCQSRILATCATSDELIFFHEDEIQAQRFVGGVEIFRTRTITTETGVFSGKSLVCSLEQVLFLGKDNIYLLADGTVIPVDTDRKVRDEIFKLPLEALRKSVAYYDRRNEDIHWYFPTRAPVVYVFNLPYTNWTNLSFDNRFFGRFPVLFINIPLTPQNNFHYLGADGSIYDVRQDDNTEGGADFLSVAEFLTDLGTRQKKILYEIELSVEGSGTLKVGYATPNNSEVEDLQRIYTEVEVTISENNHLEVPSVQCTGAQGRFIAIKLETSDNLLIRSFSLKYDLEGL